MKTEDFKDLIRPIVYKYGSGWLLDNPEMLEEICKKYHTKQLRIGVVVNNEAIECNNILSDHVSDPPLCEKYVTTEISEVKLFCDFDDGEGSVNCPVIGNVECEDCRYLNTK